MSFSRKEFLGAAAGGMVLILLPGCGGGGGDDDAQPTGSCGASGAAIAGNHGHVLVLAPVDLDAATAQTYDITGTANHPHAVTFTPAQLQALKAGQTVVVASTTNSAHAHQVSARCA